VRQAKVNKLTSPYNPTKLKVTCRRGSWVVGTDEDGKEIARNVSFFKRLIPESSSEIEDGRISAGEDESESEERSESQNDIDETKPEFTTPELPPLEAFDQEDLKDYSAHKSEEGLSEKTVQEQTNSEGNLKTTPARLNFKPVVEPPSGNSAKPKTPAPGETHEKRKAAIRKSKSRSRQKNAAEMAKDEETSETANEVRPRRKVAQTASYSETACWTISNMRLDIVRGVSLLSWTTMDVPRRHLRLA